MNAEFSFDYTLKTVNLSSSELSNTKEHGKLPFYMRSLLKERDIAYFNYLHSKTLTNKVTFWELNEICKVEKGMIAYELSSLNHSDKLIDILENIDNAIWEGYETYRETIQQRALDILAGLFQVKDVVKRVKELKRSEYEMLGFLSISIFQ